jgi:hypothetical protein
LEGGEEEKKTGVDVIQVYYMHEPKNHREIHYSVQLLHVTKKENISSNMKNKRGKVFHLRMKLKRVR